MNRIRLSILVNSSRFFIQQFSKEALPETAKMLSKHKKIIYLNPIFKKKPNVRYIMLGGFLSFFGFEEPDLVTFIKRGILCIQREEYSKAEQLLHLALKIAQEQNDRDGITYVYDTLANLALEVKQYKKAETIFKTVMQRLLQDGYPQDDIKIIHISLKLAEIYRFTEEYSKCEKGYEFCVQNLEKKITLEAENASEDLVALYGMTQESFAKYLHSTNKSQEALAHLEKAYEICVKLFGKHHTQTVILLSNMGTVLSSTGEFDKALKCLQDAVEIGRTLSDFLDLGSIYVNLGKVYLIKQLYDEAKLNCETGLRISEKNENQEGIEAGKECLAELKVSHK